MRKRKIFPLRIFASAAQRVRKEREELLVVLGRRDKVVRRNRPLDEEWEARCEKLIPLSQARLYVVDAPV